MTPIRIYLIGGLTILVLLGFAGWQNSCLRVHEDRAKVLEGQIVQLKTTLAQDQVDIKNAQALAVRNAQAVQVARVVYRDVPAPPPVLEAPRLPSELDSRLVGMGLGQGLTVTASKVPSTLSDPDARLVFDWGQKALQVPAMQLKVSTGTALIQAQDTQIQSMWDLKKDQAKGLADCQTLSATQDKEVHELGKALAISKRYGWKKWLYLGGGLAVGYLVGHK